MDGNFWPLPLATRQPHKVVPDLANSITAGNGAYAQIDAGIGPLVLSNIYGEWAVAAFTNSTMVVAKGAAAAEVDVASVGFRGDERCGYDLPMHIIIDAATRLSAKGTNANRKVKLGYYDLPLWQHGDLDAAVREHQGGFMLNTDNATLTDGAAGWNYGSYAQYIASAAYDLLLLGFSANYDVNTQIEVGIGAGGSEVGIGEFIVPNGSAASDSASYFPIPIFVYSGERVAVRGATSGGAKSQVAYLYYYELRPAP